MRIKHFLGTDTALVEFSDRLVEETREINENVYIDLDKEGNLVSMTIEHAKSQAGLAEVSYQQIEAGLPDGSLPPTGLGRTE